MLNAVSLDQLRVFIAAAEEGSFSAAARQLRRAQSLISQTITNLENQLNVKLFDRTNKFPRLTDQGKVLMREAKTVIESMDAFKARAKVIAEGMEPELSVVIDAIYPMDKLTSAVDAFREIYPNVPLRIYVEALGATIHPVMDGNCRIGVIGSLPNAPDVFHSEPLLEVPFVSVVAPNHALAAVRGVVPMRTISEHVQIVLTDRTTLTEGKNFGVLSPNTWRVADLAAKQAFLRAGFGWGHMPVPMIKDDLAAGRLVKIRIEGFVVRAQILVMQAIYRKDAPPGPAGRAFINLLKYKRTTKTR